MAESDLELIRGTFDLLILKTLAWGPMHGLGVLRWIETVTEQRLLIEEGALYPALHRLEARGWIAASWELSDKGKRARYYRLTAAGRKHLGHAQSKWLAMSRAIGLILNPTKPERS